MMIEAALAVTAGILAASIALAGFGLDSVTEFFSALIVVWQLHGQGQERETRAVRLIGVTFFALAAYLAAEGIRDLTSQARAEHSLPRDRCHHGSADHHAGPGDREAPHRTADAQPCRARRLGRDRFLCGQLRCRPPGYRAERSARVVAG